MIEDIFAMVWSCWENTISEEEERVLKSIIRNNYRTIPKVCINIYDRANAPHLNFACEPYSRDWSCLFSFWFSVFKEVKALEGISYKIYCLWLSLIIYLRTRYLFWTLNCKAIEHKCWSWLIEKLRVQEILRISEPQWFCCINAESDIIVLIVRYNRSTRTKLIEIAACNWNIIIDWWQWVWTQW